MLTLSKYIEDNEVPFFNSIDYAPFNDSNFVDMLNEWCKFNHGSLQIRPLIEDALKTDADVIRKRVTNLINVRKYKYTKLYDTTLLEYNPIENYDNNEESTTTIGVKEENFKKGANIDKTEVGQGTITTKSDVTSYESNTFADADKVTTDESARTTTSTMGERSDIRTEKEHVDKLVKHIHGNIGVTTSQQMIESELELRKRNVVTEYLTEFATMYFFIDD